MNDRPTPGSPEALAQAERTETLIAGAFDLQAALADICGGRHYFRYDYNRAAWFCDNCGEEK